jgi:repressor LexA
MEDLTARQAKVFNFIESHSKRYGYPPTIREIAAHIGAKWSHGVERHLEALEKKGYIRKESVKSRGISLTRAAIGTQVPLIGRITAGRPILAVENVGESILIDPAFVRGGENHFLLMIEGLSMKNAGILDGDLVLVRQQSTAEQGDIVAALIGDETATVKRFRQDDDRIVLEPENPDFEPIVSDSSSVKIIGKVMAVLRLLDNQLTVKKLR